MNAHRVVRSYALAAGLAVATASSLDAQQTTPPRPQSANAGTISGTVTRPATNDPIDQVSVRVVGTSLGATTNAQGRYVIANVSPGIYVVEATRIGLAPARKENVNVTASSTVTVDLSMSERALIMDAVVATGLNDPTSGRNAPFSIAKVSAEEIKVPAVGDVLGSLAGKVAGATIRPSGQPGGDLSIQLRSPTSFRGNTQPMIIVD